MGNLDNLGIEQFGLVTKAQQVAYTGGLVVESLHMISESLLCKIFCGASDCTPKVVIIGEGGEV